MGFRLGELLVQQGLLSEEDVESILDAQRRSGRPFGQLAERMFGLTPSQVEAAWAEQYRGLAPHVDPVTEGWDPTVQGLVSRRQAWQFRVLPIRRNGCELTIATTTENLPRAARFAAWHFGEPIYFVIGEAARLEQALALRYPLPGVGCS